MRSLPKSRASLAADWLTRMTVRAIHVHGYGVFITCIVLHGKGQKDQAIRVSVYQLYPNGIHLPVFLRDILLHQARNQINEEIFLLGLCRLNDAREIDEGQVREANSRNLDRQSVSSLK